VKFILVFYSKCNIDFINFLKKVLTRVFPDYFPEYLEPTIQKELGSFLGLASYYFKFVRAFAEKAHPLIALTKKSAQWKWGTEDIGISINIIHLLPEVLKLTCINYFLMRERV
jgi:hypothetical protein